ncbi:MAG TPA: hypothetical protein VK155_11925 [Bacteroidales bacterium]|jgi:hypothetical protein|nr:hypothetical protein [Bacteroidales bacterium]
MKKIILIPAFQLLLISLLQAQPVTDYLYKLDNGITVKNEHAWNQVWVQQTYSPISAADQSPLTVNIRTLGDLTSGLTYTLMSKGKEVKLKGAAPGTYDLRLVCKLAAQPGTISFSVGNVVIKPKTKTSVAVTLYDYQVSVSESPSSAALSPFETELKRCKLTPVQQSLFGVPSFYTPGNHNTPLKPDEMTGNTKGKIKPGKYDVLLTVGISNQNHKIWLEGFEVKQGKSYKIAANLNAGGIVYSGGDRNVKEMRLYPAGTSAKQAGNAAPVKNMETIFYTDILNINCCPPGTFDVLLKTGGDKFEWRKNVAVTTGTKTEVK